MAAGIEQAGFGALWLGSSPGGDLAQVDELLDVTSTLIVGTSIVNIWKDGPHEVARAFARVQDRHPGRFVLGVGAGHPEATQKYERPYDALASYVDVLRGDGVPLDALMLAALVQPHINPIPKGTRDSFAVPCSKYDKVRPTGFFCCRFG